MRLVLETGQLKNTVRTVLRSPLYQSTLVRIMYRSVQHRFRQLVCFDICSGKVYVASQLIATIPPPHRLVN
jgi:hypothetical protein